MEKETLPNWAILTFIAKGNKYNIRESVENYPVEEYYIGNGAIKLNEREINGIEIKPRLSDILRISPIKIENAKIIFNESEKIEKEYYNLDISNFIIGYEEKEWRGDEKERKRTSNLILLEKPGYRTGGVYLHTKGDKLEILANGSCFIDHVNHYYKNQKNQNRIICLTYATAQLNSGWSYNINSIVNKTKQEMSNQRVMFVNLKNFERKIIF